MGLTGPQVQNLKPEAAAWPFGIIPGSFVGIPALSQGKHIHVTHNTRVLQGNILSAWMKGCGRQSSREPLPPACVSLYHLLIIAPAAQQCVGGFNINAFESNQ